MMRHFDKDIVLQTERLALRYLRSDDSQAIFHNINHDSEVLRYYVTEYAEKEAEFSLDELIGRFIAREQYILAIIIRETGEVIGNILQCNSPSRLMNTVELGFAIGRDHWNKGYMSEALKAMIDLMFACGIHKVTACHMKENPASGRVMAKCGMRYEGTRVDDIFYRGRYWDCDYYYIIRSESDETSSDHQIQ